MPSKIGRCGYFSCSITMYMGQRQQRLPDTGWDAIQPQWPAARQASRDMCFGVPCAACTSAAAVALAAVRVGLLNCSPPSSQGYKRASRQGQCSAFAGNQASLQCLELGIQELRHFQPLGLLEKAGRDSFIQPRLGGR